MAGPIPSRASGKISSTASAIRCAAEWRMRASSYARASSRSTAMSMLAMSSCVSVISVTPLSRIASCDSRQPRAGHEKRPVSPTGTPDRRGSTLIPGCGTQCRLLDLAGNGAYRASLRSLGSFSGRLLGGFHRGHVEPDSQRQPVFLAMVPRLLVPIDAVARQLTDEE